MNAVHRTLASCVIAALAGSCIPEVASRDARVAGALIREAGEAGAREDPEAERYLALAERGLARARTLIEVGDAQGARAYARRARADAEIAHLLAIEGTLRRAALRSEADAMDLERQIEARSAEAARGAARRR